MKTSDIINLAGHEILTAIETAQYKILAHDDSRPDVRIEGIIRLHEIQKKLNRDINMAISRLDTIER